MSDPEFKVTLDEQYGKTATGTLKHGLEIAGKLETDFTMREALAGDMFAAEDKVGLDKPLAFSAAMIAEQLVKVGRYDMPVTYNMIKKAKPGDYALLRKAQEALEEEGEPEQHGDQNT
ncbi:MAG: phage tail assembly protein [Candidatus Sedimenticola sp. (ex Thyasira tokunagai)]